MKGRTATLSPEVLRYWVDHHNSQDPPTRSAHRLVSSLQQPLVERLKVIRVYTRGPFTQMTLDEAIAVLEERPDAQ